MSDSKQDLEPSEVELAFERTLELQTKGDWAAWLLTLTEDAVYVECEFGVMRGRAEIGAWLLPDMERAKDWTFPERYRVIEGNSVCYGWWNRLPGTRAMEVTTNSWDPATRSTPQTDSSPTTKTSTI